MKELRIEDISLGDWVLCKGEYWRISAINENSVGLRADDDYCVAELIECAAIYITSEILEKNGLMKVSEEECYEEYCCNDFLIRRSKFSCTDWWQVDVHYKQYVAHLSGYIQYVHQLQHLLTINECDKKIKV